MFVETVRLLIVFLCTAAGFALAPKSTSGGGNVLGATLGACVGYVAGGVFGRLLQRAMGAAERQVERASGAQLLAGGLGAILLSVPAGLLGLPAVVLVPGRWGWPVLGLMLWVGMYEGFRLGVAKSNDLLGLAGLSSRETPDVDNGPTTSSAAAARAASLVDTSALIDGRVLAVAEAGFLPGELLVPRFVLDELQGIADAADGGRRRKGRRGLEVLEALGKQGSVRVVDDGVPELEEVDAKLVALARRLGAALMTTDANLQWVAELQGVPCRNLNRLAAGLRPAHGPGDVLRLPIAREGKEPGQGVGFLMDGTMVVVGEAAGFVGRDVDVRVTSNVQTSVGRMLFASVVSG